MTDAILQAAFSCINKKTLSETKSTHPWLSEGVMQAVEAKRVASSTADEGAKSQECSRIVLEEYDRWVSQVRQSASCLRRSRTRMLLWKLCPWGGGSIEAAQ